MLRKTNYTRIIVCLLATMLIYVILGIGNIALVKADSTEPRPIKVGFFAFDGYHNIDENGNKSGYGYEVLQLMKRHENWKYDYIGYEKNWDSMLDMLDNGEIDMVTSAGKTPEREAKFDYSAYDIGHNSVVLTVREDDERYTAGGINDYNGMTIGVLSGNEKNTSLENFATQKGFTYTAKEYSSTKELEQALQNEDVDGIFTSNLRRVENEKVLEEFDNSGFFVVVKKGNSELLEEINHALVRMNEDDPQWKARLRLKYYEVGKSEQINLTSEDSELISKIKADGKVFKILARPDNKPYSYLEDGKIKGILPDLFAKIAESIEIRYQYLIVENAEQYYNALNDRQADMTLDFVDSYQKAESFDMTIAGTYVTTPISVVYHRRTSKDIQKVALTTELFAGAQEHYGDRVEFITVASFDTCVEMLKNNECDMALLPSLRADSLMLFDYKNEYISAQYSVEKIDYSLLVKQGSYTGLSSLMSKACALISDDDVNSLRIKYINREQNQVTIVTLFYTNPRLFFTIMGVVLLSVICVLFIMIRSRQKLKKNNVHLLHTNKFLLENDALTGGYNQDGFIKAIENLRNNGVDLSKNTILFVEIKEFNAISEMVGKQKGDEILISLYENINEIFAPDISAKIDSEHLAFFLSQEKRDFERLKKALNFEIEVDGKVLQIHCLCGINEIRDGNESVEQMLYCAKVARYFLTETPHEPYMLFEPFMNDIYIEQAEILTNYENAIYSKEFEVYYQPIIDTKTGKIASAEALIRWKKDDKMISPAMFIPVLEKNGYISKLDSYVEKTVYDFLLSRKQQGERVVPISVNLSGADFGDKEFMSRIFDKGRIEKIDFGMLRYEITETVYAELESKDFSFIERMKVNGIAFLLDDFGSGYSSFGMIQNYQFEILKIDMSFIKKMMTNEKVKTIVQTIINMSHALSMKVVAEGVETKEQLEFLKESNCDFIQGYYFSKPLRENEFIDYMSEHRDD